MNKEELIKNLNSFIGTETYHRVSFNLDGTDGIKYLCDKAKCYWLMDIVGSVLYKTKKHSFLIWRIERKGEGAIISCYTDCEEDGTFSKEKEVYSQEIKYTDFPLDEFEFYQQGNVVMLKNEYWYSWTKYEGEKARVFYLENPFW